MNTNSPLKIPRIESLHHRLMNAKDADGQPLALLDELMVFLEDPPPDVGDRWQVGADWCAAQGIPTSRVAVWSFYRAHVLQWTRTVAPVFEEGDGETSKKRTDALLEQVRHLAVLRTVESLQHPHLPPRVLVGMVQNENRRQELLLERAKFEDHLETKERQLERERQAMIRKEKEEEARARAGSEMSQRLLKQIMALTPGKKASTTSPSAV